MNLHGKELKLCHCFFGQDIMKVSFVIDEKFSKFKS
jgi:hypothetical protein